MTRIVRWLSVLVPVALAACGGQIAIGAGGSSGGVGIGAGYGGIVEDPYKASIEDWHAGRIKRLKADDGWLTLVGLFPLTEGSHTLGSAKDNEMQLPSGPAHAGTLVVQDTTVTLTPSADAKMTLNGQPVGEMALVSDRNGNPSKIQMGSIQFYVIDRAPNRFLRVKDANSPTRKNFDGITRYKVDPAWKFDATFIKYNPPHPIKVPNILGYDDNVMCPGVLVFHKDGQEYRIEPLAQEGDELSIVFGDATSGHETYGGGRELYCPMPGPDGHTVLDFNKAYNPPCVFTKFATCPLPHAGNVLPFKVEAGEKMYVAPKHIRR